MEIVNATKMQAGYTLGMDPDGREYLVVAVKGTFAMPLGSAPQKRQPELADEQVPLVMADEPTGEPGFSATRYESEFPLFKPRCDVLLNGSAYAPGGQPTKKVQVSMAVGPVKKSFKVTGDRVWDKVLASTVPSEPKPFIKTTISYDRAYGGVDVAPDKPDKPNTYQPNPVGVGHYPLTPKKELIGKPLPNTAQPMQPINVRSGRFKPMALGPIGRNFKARVAYAGTYDQQWLDEVFPFLPADFNPLYHQSAPADQQIDHPRGGEEITLLNLTPTGETRFQIPTIEVPVEFTDASYERTQTQAVLDTIILEPDQERFMLVWRASKPLKKNIMEMKQAVVGRMPRGWYRARDLGKTYYPSLAALIDARRNGDEDEDE